MLERSRITELLGDWNRGDPAAANLLFEHVYDDLRAMADRIMQRERPGHTLQPTALVHEAYGRLLGHASEWRDRRHFLAVVSQVMRRFLVDYARGRNSKKRGKEFAHIALEDLATIADDGSAEDLIELDAAMKRLGQRDPRKEKVVELHYFGGFTQPEIAEALDVSPVTVARDLRMAQAWLRRELSN